MNFRIAPDSLLKSIRGDSRSVGMRWEPWIWLVWLFWLFGPLIFGSRNFPNWLWPTLASLPVFLALYWRAYACERRNVIWYVIAIALLTGLVTPANPFVGSYLIYACAVVGACAAPRKAIGLIAVMMLLYGAEWLLLDYAWQYLVNTWVFCPIVGGIGIYERIERERRAELRLTMDEVRRLAATAERERIGRDLHDLLGHTLSLVTLKSELAGRLIERDPRAARQEIAEVERVARDALAQVRSAVSGIRAAALVSELASARLLLETAGVQMEYWRDERELPSDVETCLALVLREAVTNVQRHARANRVEVTVIAGEERVVMRVRDDGRGGVNARGNGLTGMRERAQAMGGELSIDSVRGRGTTIEVSLPIPAATAKQAVRNLQPMPAPSVRPAGSHA